MKNFLFVLLCLVSLGSSGQARKTENVILITFDGFRWQEMFQGADTVLMKQQEHLKDPNLKEKFWRPERQERREALLPFFWTTVATKGQLYGNRDKGSNVNVTNKMWFSYPGYNEILTGKADDENITSNDKIYNPNTNVLEFINTQDKFKGKVAAFTSWDVFPYIINDKRSGVFVSAGLMPSSATRKTEREILLDEMLKAIPNPLGEIRLDAFTFYYGMEYLKKNKPRVMYFGFDETDDFAHGGEYGAYLNAAHYTDRFIAELWDYLQTDPQYKDKTTLIITTDHGRGITEEEWKHHGIKISHADEIWMAILGPDTKPLTEEKLKGQFYQNQVARTIASLLGLKFGEEEKAGGPMTAAIP